MIALLHASPSAGEIAVLAPDGNPILATSTF
jgi:hypothetical protein